MNNSLTKILNKKGRFLVINLTIILSFLLCTPVFAKAKSAIGNQKSGIACMGNSVETVSKREAKLHRKISKYANQYGINVNFIKAVIAAESCYNRKAVSPAGAQGLMQLMPRTAKWLGVTNAFDVDQNLEAGIRYLSRLKKRFDNNYKLTLAAYNAGPGNVRKHNGIPPFGNQPSASGPTGCSINPLTFTPISSQRRS